MKGAWTAGGDWAHGERNVYGLERHPEKAWGQGDVWPLCSCSPGRLSSEPYGEQCVLGMVGKVWGLQTKKKPWKVVKRNVDHKTGPLHLYHTPV